MRYYLDTNILVFFLFDNNELSQQIRDVVFDYSNILLTSTICVHELVHLCQIGKISDRKKNGISATAIIEKLKNNGILISGVSEKHLYTMAILPFHGDHRDPNDRLIVAQAIADRIPLISSDRKFNEYIQDGLDFIYNER